MTRKHLICLTIFFFIYYSSYPQEFGGNPPSVKWNQINSTNARIIFSKSSDSIAQKINSILIGLSDQEDDESSRRRKKVNIVLQDRTTISNGYVGLAPFRSEFYLTPYQNSFDLGSLPWEQQLALHEYRHVQQFRDFDVGLSRVLHVIFGQEAQALASNAAIPDWFFEGDAVYHETKLSRQGRGRLSYFFNPFRALWLAGRKYNWMKLRNGSLKNFVPGHYELGYILVAYGYQKYGTEFWKRVTHDAASYKSLLYPFQKSISKYAGVTYQQFRTEAIHFFENQFDSKKQDEAGKPETFVNEQYPAYTPGGIVYVKSGYDQIPVFVLRSDKGEIKLRVKDVSIDNHFSANQKKIVYAAFQPDIRWGNQNFSDLKVIDILSGKETTLTKHSKYFSPDINANSTEVVAVNQPAAGNSSLHILNAKDGEVLNIIPNPAGLLYTYPRFFDTTRIISAVRDTSGKMAVASIIRRDGKIELLTPFTYSVIGFPFVKNDTIFFTAALEQYDELLAVTSPGKKLWRLSFPAPRGIGKYQVAVNDSFITFSTFSVNGYKVFSIPRQNVILQEIDSTIFFDNRNNFKVSALNRTTVPEDYASVSPQFPVTKYSKSSRLFNFHSLEPAVNDPDYSLYLVGENVLNTFQSQIGINYNRAEKSKEVNIAGAYGGLFPIFRGGISYSFDRKIAGGGNKTYSFDELEPFVGFNIPLNLSKGRSLTFFNFGSNYIFNSTIYKGFLKDSLKNRHYSYLSNYLSFTHQSQTARQQIFPAFAQSLSLAWKKAFANDHSFQFFAKGNLYLPGFIKNHALVLNGAVLFKDTGNVINFSSGFPFSRGYNAVNLQNMLKWGLSYHLPYACPDFGFANVLYVLRIRGSFFYDATTANDPGVSGGNMLYFNSTGTELFFDTKWWNQVNVSFGFRYSYLLNKNIFGSGGTRWEIILPVNVLSR